MKQEVIHAEQTIFRLVLHSILRKPTTVMYCEDVIFKVHLILRGAEFSPEILNAKNNCHTLESGLFLDAFLKAVSES